MFHQKFERRNLNLGSLIYRSVRYFQFFSSLSFEIEFFHSHLWEKKYILLLLRLFQTLATCKFSSEMERHLVVFNRVNNRRDNGADMSTCKLREIHSHVRAESLVHLVAPMGVIQLIIYYHRVVFTIFVSQSFSGYGDSGIIFEQSS